ncbi:MAG TPA: nitrilase family protein [Chitinophagaceae bacterium]|nr:nitrilase family protein [Chitinophagaceae bacterium]
MSKLTVTLIQSNLHWEDKSANLQLLEEKIRSVKERTELVILPEMFNTGFSLNPEKLAETMDGTTLEWMKRISSEKNIILTGSLIVQEGGNYYNRLVWMLPNGQYGLYDKRHRFAYAGEDQQFAAGDKRLIASAKGWKINLLVCYDLRFPVWARQHSNMSMGMAAEPAGFEYDLLIYVANWPEKRIHAWNTLLQARAIENQCYTIGLNRVGLDGNNIYYNGNSMIVDPLGEILYQKNEIEDVYTCTLEKQKLEEVRNRFPFWRDADAFQIFNEQSQKDKTI